MLVVALLADRSRRWRSPARWRAKKIRAGRRGHAADAHAAVRRAAGRHGAARRRADVRPGARARARSSSTCRCSATAEHKDRNDDHVDAPKPDRCSTRRSCGARSSTRSASSIRASGPQPGDVRRVRRQHPDDAACGVQALVGQRRGAAGFIFGVSAWLWFTVLFANFAEAMAEGRGKAQADVAAQGAHATCTAKKLDEPRRDARASSSCRRRRCARTTSSWSRPATSSPATAKSIEGVASVDESAITGESAPGHPRERRRPQQRHRRHARALRLARRPRHGRTRARRSSTA